MVYTVINRCGSIHYLTHFMCQMVSGKAVCSHFVFCILLYLDGFLDRLGESSVGCYWGGHFAGALCYADDIVLLAPSASALRRMLSICESYYATSHGLIFDANKTQ